MSKEISKSNAINAYMLYSSSFLSFCDLAGEAGGSSSRLIQSYVVPHHPLVSHAPWYFSMIWQTANTLLIFVITWKNLPCFSGSWHKIVWNYLEIQLYSLKSTAVVRSCSFLTCMFFPLFWFLVVTYYVLEGYAWD